MKSGVQMENDILELERPELFGLITVPIRGDNRGKLVAVENMNGIPFEMKRIFMIYGTSSDAVRGAHANRDSSFAFLTIAGSCRVRLKTHKGTIADEELASPDKLLWIDRMVWKEMYDFSDDCILVVISDHLYNPHEYINGFDEYKTIMAEWVANGRNS
ncbi:MAG: FdtA/QdtA family cupin domain-containing protein [Acetobacter sp.]|uniref:sugar 3,4-ketoisomerase n=1 Tax=Acetobacter sp. TaxID=440 RepID=UPI003CFDB8E1